MASIPKWKVFNAHHGIAQEPSWAHSLAWLEHPADNREVTGPNPVGPTPTHWLIPDTYGRPYDRFQVYAELISWRHLVLAEDLL